MLKRSFISALVLLVATGFSVKAEADNETPKAGKPFSWKVSGDTAQDFKLEFVAGYKVDRSSPTSLVNSFAAYTDDRESMQQEMNRIGRKWESAVSKSLEGHEQKLLTEDAFAALHEEDEGEVSYRQVKQPMEVTEVESAEDGVEWVEAVQKSRVTQKDWESDEMETTEKTQRYRYRCVRSKDGNYLIDGIERWREDWGNLDKDGNPAMTWVEETNLFVFMLLMQEAEENPELPAVSQSTAKEAANSLINELVPYQEALAITISHKGMGSWYEFIGAMFTERYRNAAEEQKDEWADEEEEAERVIDTVEEKDGVTTVKFKQRNDWSGPIELKLKKRGDVWKVDEIGYYELAFDTDGNKIWKYNADPNIYSYSYR